MSWALLLVAMAATAPTHADDSPHEIYWHTGFAFLSGPDRVAAGLGGGPGYRLHLSERWSVDAEASWLVAAGNVVALSVGGNYSLRFGWYQPLGGIRAGTIFGAHIRTLTSDHPRPPPGAAFFAQLSLAPLRFAAGRFSASALEVRFGFATSRDSPARVLSLTILAVGVRL